MRRSARFAHAPPGLKRGKLLGLGGGQPTLGNGSAAVALRAVVHRLAVRLVALAACILAMLGGMRIVGGIEICSCSLEIGARGDLLAVLGDMVAIAVEAKLVLFDAAGLDEVRNCLLYTSPSPRDRTRSRMPSSA